MMRGLSVQSSLHMHNGDIAALISIEMMHSADVIATCTLRFRIARITVELGLCVAFGVYPIGEDEDRLSASNGSLPFCIILF